MRTPLVAALMISSSGCRSRAVRPRSRDHGCRASKRDDPALDNSGSMAHAMWHGELRPGSVLRRGAGPERLRHRLGAGDRGLGRVLRRKRRQPGSLSRQREPDQSSGNHVHCDLGTVPGGCSAAPAGWSCSTGSRYHFTLPEFTSGGTTRWSKNYLSWLFTELLNGNTPTIPHVDRIETARDALLELVDLGLPRFRRHPHYAMGPGLS